MLAPEASTWCAFIAKVFSMYNQVKVPGGGHPCVSLPVGQCLVLLQEAPQVPARVCCW
jgi:hypothetical protein